MPPTANLATVVAQSNQRVLLIDGDMRRGSLHKLIGGKAEVGLSELITGQAELAAATRQVGLMENLHFIARGKLPPNPSELLMNARFSALLEHLRPLYDLIIIDGRARVACLERAVRFLAEGGLIVFDNSGRKRYQAALRRQELRIERCRGRTPALPYPSETTLIELQHG